MIAAISGAADPVMVPAMRETGHLPDFASLPEDVLNRTTAAYICSPANPQGAVATRAYWADLIALAENTISRFSRMNAIQRSTATRRPSGRYKWRKRSGPIRIVW